jgi:hypothetical protein
VLKLPGMLDETTPKLVVDRNHVLVVARLCVEHEIELHSVLVANESSLSDLGSAPAIAAFGKAQPGRQEVSLAGGPAL